MENAVPKIKQGLIDAPIGAGIGAVVGYAVAKQLGYHKAITVIGFTMVGLILGFTISKRIKK